jgi:hypothetical protein
MSFTRTFTEQDHAVFGQVETVLVTRGIILKEGQPHAEHNGMAILTWFDKNPNVPISIDAMLSVVNQLVNELRHSSTLAKEFNILLATMTRDEFLNLQDFLRRYSLIQIDGSQEGFKNATLLIPWIRRYGYPVDVPSLAYAMEGFLRNTDPRQQLNFVVKKQPRAQRFAHEDDPDREPGQLLDKPATSREYVAGRKNHALDPDFMPKPIVPVLDAAEAQWKRMAEEKMTSGKTHSQKANLKEAFEHAWATTGSYRKVYEAVNAIVKRHQQGGY